MSENASGESFLQDKKSRRIVDSSIREVCISRGYSLYAINVRTNHVHVVISAQTKPEKVINTIKSYATRKLRAAGSVGEYEKVWSRGGSRKYLWKNQDVERAMDYVLYGQGDVFWE
jgi:REP element-mobilizing transposase RayT